MKKWKADVEVIQTGIGGNKYFKETTQLYQIEKDSENKSYIIKIRIPQAQYKSIAAKAAHNKSTVYHLISQMLSRSAGQAKQFINL